MSEPGFLSAPIPGGVQVCTAEFVALFQAAGFDTLFYPVTARRDLLTRAAIRLGLDVYGRYDVEAHAAAIARQAVSTGASVIALNQMDIAPLAGRLRALLPAVPVIMLSHGNSSGDFLHESIAAGGGWLRRQRDQWRMGALVSRESRYFQHDLDLVLCLSETDEAIARWLGAREVFVVPRTFRSDLLKWQPVSARIGCVATVDHFPNRAGLERLAAALVREAVPGLTLRLVGGGAGGAALSFRRIPRPARRGCAESRGLHLVAVCQPAVLACARREYEAGDGDQLGPAGRDDTARAAGVSLVGRGTAGSGRACGHGQIDRWSPCRSAETGVPSGGGAAHCRLRPGAG